jgi:hypothetical protein
MIGKCCFGVYLIHDNNFLRVVLWGKILNNSAYENSPLLIAFTICSVISVFVVCTIIECIRINVIEKYVFRSVNTRIVNLAETFENKLITVLKK